jgi:branched-chain amino acid transport system substrate-binding protein
MRRRTNPAARVVSVLLTTMLVVVACGGDETEGGDGEQAETVKFGLLVPLSGELGSFGGPWEDAGKLAVKEMNDSGALPGGTTIETVTDDEKVNPEVAVQAARRMIEVESVSAIMVPTSASMVALVPLAQRNEVPVISPAAGTVALNELGGDFIYRTVASDASDGLAAARFLEDQGAGSVVALVQNEESTLSPAEIFINEFESAGGQVLERVVYNPGQPSYRAELENALQANPEWIFCACGQESGVTLLKEADAAGYDGQWMVTADIVAPEVIEAVGPDIMEGVYGEIATSDTSLPTYQEFADAYKSEYGEPPYAFNANMYDATILAGLAMVAADSTDGAAINEGILEVASGGTACSSFEECAEALSNGEDVNYEGASGPVDLDETGTASSPYSIQQVKNGKWKQIEFLPADLFTEAAG